MVQESSRERLLGGVWVPLLLLALALLALVGRDSASLVRVVDNLCYAIGSTRRSLHGGASSRSNSGRDLKLVEVAIFTGEDRSGVLHVCA